MRLSNCMDTAASRGTPESMEKKIDSPGTWLNIGAPSASVTASRLMAVEWKMRAADRSHHKIRARDSAWRETRRAAVNAPISARTIKNVERGSSFSGRQVLTIRWTSRNPGASAQKYHRPRRCETKLIAPVPKLGG